MSEGYWDHIKDAFDKVSIYDGPEVFAKDVTKLPEYAGDLLAAHWFLSEMSNGGIWQFFDNSTAVVADRAATGFSNFGLPMVADSLRRAIAKAETKTEDSPFELFEKEEKEIYAVGGSDLGRIYDRMDEYAKSRRS